MFIIILIYFMDSSLNAEIWNMYSRRHMILLINDFD